MLPLSWKLQEHHILVSTKKHLRLQLADPEEYSCCQADNIAELAWQKYNCCDIRKAVA